VKKAWKMKIGVVRETFPGERRVGLVPSLLGPLCKAGLEVLIESGAGQLAGYPDSEYQEKGAAILATRDEVFQQADILFQVRTGGANPDAIQEDLPRYRKGQVVIGMADPMWRPDSIQQLADCGVTLFALEKLPRISRAQSMDVLSSMAMLAGYRSVLLASVALSKMFPMMMTAAGTVKPAKVFIVGAGVAGLQAIATARRLGAMVEAYDVRPAVKEEAESLGARFLEIPMDFEQSQDSGGYARQLDEAFYQRQREMMTRVVGESDVVITTAAIPGKKAPLLVTAEMVRGMRPGSVVVDLAAERGGNCEFTQSGKTVEEQGVTIIGPDNLPSDLAHDSSKLYAKNISTFLLHLLDEGQMKFDLEDEITRDTLILRDGLVLDQAVADLIEKPPTQDDPDAATPDDSQTSPSNAN
jgi:NAD(P) transhydrogenase subunit alpha